MYQSSRWDTPVVTKQPTRNISTVAIAPYAALHLTGVRLPSSGTWMAKKYPYRASTFYREGYGDKWAVVVPTDGFLAVGDAWMMYEQFLQFCNVTRPPNVVRELFTLIREIQVLIDSYYAWLKDKTVLNQIDQWVEITTPYLDRHDLDRHDDYLQIYARDANGGFVLTDDGYTIEDLAQSGCNLESPKRQDLLQMTLNGFGVHRDGRELQVLASADNFAIRKHNLLQAMLAVNDMFYMAAPTVANIFYEDVEAWLDLYDIRHTPKVKFTGQTGYDHNFDFVIPKSRERPERLIQTVNRPSRSTVQNVVLAWIDTKEVRTPGSRVYALLNDSERKVDQTVMAALRSYDVRPVVWSQREDAKVELAA